MATHTAYGGYVTRRWTGTPEDLAAVVRRGEDVFESATGERVSGHLTVRTDGGESQYDSPDGFLAECVHRPRLRNISVGYSTNWNRVGGRVSASFHLYRFVRGPFVAVSADDPALAEGLAKRLTDAVGGRRFRWPGMSLHQPGQGAAWAWAKTALGGLLLVAAGSAVTVIVQRLLS